MHSHRNVVWVVTLEDGGCQHPVAEGFFASSETVSVVRVRYRIACARGLGRYDLSLG